MKKKFYIIITITLVILLSGGTVWGMKINNERKAAEAIVLKEANRQISYEYAVKKVAEEVAIRNAEEAAAKKIAEEEEALRKTNEELARKAAEEISKPKTNVTKPKAPIDIGEGFHGTFINKRGYFVTYSVIKFADNTYTVTYTETDRSTWGWSESKSLYKISQIEYDAFLAS